MHTGQLDVTALNLKPLIADAGLITLGAANGLILAEALRPSAAVAASILASVTGSAMVATLTGPVAARDLVAGHKVLTRDNGYAAVRGVQVLSGEAGLLVAAGVLGNPHDMVLPTRAGVMISGPSFETLFGAREVIVPAGALLDGTSVRPMSQDEHFESVVIDLHDAELLWADDVALSCPAKNVAARPVLSGRDAAVAARLAGFGTATRAADAA